MLAEMRVADFQVDVDGRRKSRLDAPLVDDAIKKNHADPDLDEPVVRVAWIKAVPVDGAYWAKGLVAKQHTACKLRSSFTLERLARHFDLDDDA